MKVTVLKSRKHKFAYEPFQSSVLVISMETFCFTFVTAGSFNAWDSSQVLRIAALKELL